jgi:nitroreductase
MFLRGDIMHRKLLTASFLAFSLIPILAFGQSRNETIASFISSVYSNKSFTTIPVDKKDIETILKCGIKAPSARNSQPWHFTVVKDVETMKSIIPGTLEGNILIVVSGEEQNKGVDFGCGLATENIFLAAQALGYGSHIYTGPIAKLNDNYKEMIGIPTGFTGISIIKIGNIEKGIDAMSSASERKSEADLANYH